MLSLARSQLERFEQHRPTLKPLLTESSHISRLHEVSGCLYFVSGEHTSASACLHRPLPFRIHSTEELNGGCLQVIAYPSEYLGCDIPQRSYGGHGSPIVAESISFELKAENGSTVTVFETGAPYALTISSQKSARAWIHVSVGTVEALGVGIEPRTCDQAWGSSHKAKEHTVLWRAPKNSTADGICCVISTAVATGEKAHFQTNSVRHLTFCVRNAPIGNQRDTQDTLKLMYSVPCCHSPTTLVVQVEANHAFLQARKIQVPDLTGFIPHTYMTCIIVPMDDSDLEAAALIIMHKSTDK